MELSSKQCQQPVEALLHFICPLSLVSEFPLHEILSEYCALPYNVRVSDIFHHHSADRNTCFKIVMLDDMDNLVLYHNL